MDIIDFFRSIDGVLYYVLLAVNTILIFAIIGYLGEQNNKKIMQMSFNTSIPNNSGTKDFSMPETQKHSDMPIPTVAPTTVNNNVPSEVTPNNLVVPNVAIQTVTPVIANANTNSNPGVMINSVNSTNTLPVTNQNSIPTPQVMPNQINQNVMTVNDNPPQVNNEISSTEKAPTVLVINSQNTDMPK